MGVFSEYELNIIKSVFNQQLSIIEHKINHYNQMILKKTNDNYYKIMLEKEQQRFLHYEAIFKKTLPNRDKKYKKE